MRDGDENINIVMLSDALACGEVDDMAAGRELLSVITLNIYKE